MCTDKVIAVDKQDDKEVVFTPEAVYVLGESSIGVESCVNYDSPFERVPCKK